MSATVSFSRIQVMSLAFQFMANDPTRGLAIRALPKDNNRNLRIVKESNWQPCTLATTRRDIEEPAADRVESPDEAVAGTGDDGGDSWHEATVRMAGELKINVMMDDILSRGFRLVL